MQQSLFERLPDPAYALDRQFRFAALNAAAERHFGLDRESLLAHTIWDALPSYRGTIHEDLLRRVALSGEATAEVVDSMFRPGRRLNVHVFPIDGGLGVCFQDVTETHLARRDLGLSERRRRDVETSARERLAELQVIYDSAPVGLCVVDRDRRFVRVNARMAEINGVAAEDHVGRTVAEVVPGLAEAAERHFARIFETGEPILDIEFSGETPARPGVLRHWIENWHPVRRHDGVVAAVNIVAMEVTELKEAAERERLLTRELHHRARNVLMVVSSLVQLSAKGDPAAFVPSLQGRIKALGRAHELLGRDRWERADLAEILRLELAAHADGDRIRVDGPHLPIGPEAAQAVAMTLHELATNAAKYGALKEPDGRLTVRWTLADDHVALEWTERDGPPVHPPGRDGFGSMLIRVNVGGALRGTFEPRWEPEGFACTLRIPLDRLAAPNPPPAAT